MSEVIEISSSQEYPVLFFDKPYSNLRRFGDEIAAYLKSEYDGVNTMGMFCIDGPSDLNCEVPCINIDKVVCRSDIDNLDEFLTQFGIKVIVFTIYRVPDLEMILHAKHLGIKTIMLQEGIIFDGTNIDGISVKNIIASMSFIPKVFWYLKTLYSMCRYDGASFFCLTNKMLFVKTKLPIFLMHYFSKPLVCDYVFINGEHWREYFRQIQGYEDNKIVLVGDHDLDSLDLEVIPEKAICYIANVLVEDGTIDKKEFLSFISSFARVLEELRIPIYVKLHPRSDEELYERLKKIGAEFVREGQMPYASAYIGHRSTLIGRALYVSDQLIIYRFHGEETCFYENFATAVCCNEEDLRAALTSIDIKNLSHDKRAAISQIYYKAPKGAFYSIACYLMDYYIDGCIAEEKNEEIEWSM